MFGMLLAIGLTATSIAPSETKPKVEVAVPSDYRWALLSGLQRRLGGNFIIAGLKDAQGDCDRQKSCATPAAVDTTALLVPVDKSGTGPSGLSIYGKSPVAIVSVIDAKWVGYSLDMRLAVFDPATRSVTRKLARVNFDAFQGADDAGGTKRLRSLDDM
jgi:hypothetical protein